MELLQRIRAAFMSARMQSRDDLLDSLADANQKHEVALVELEEIEQEVAAKGVSGPADELTLARDDKKVAAARARVATWDNQQRRLEAALKVLGEQEMRERNAADINAVDAFLSQGVEDDKELDAWAEQGATLLKRKNVNVGQVHAALSTITSNGGPRLNLPQMLTGSMPRFVYVRLFAAAGLLAYGKPGMSEHEARQLPSLAKRSADDRAYLMSQLRPKDEPPRAA